MSRLQAAEMRVWMKVAGATRLDCIRDEGIRHGLQQSSIVQVMKKWRELESGSNGEVGKCG